MFEKDLIPSKKKFDPSIHSERRLSGIVGRPQPRERNHLFVSNVRFWCMLSIIALHSVQVVGLVGAHPQLSAALPAPFKFATIGFFLISGFLLGERVDRRDPIDYFKRRVKRVFVPWLLWFGIMCALLATQETFPFHAGQSPLSKILHVGYYTALSTLINTSFWFVPNLLLSIAILLVFRRHLYSLKFGGLLLAANLVYVVNIYAQWFPSRHTQAALGFVFYLWLGSYIAQNFEKISTALARIPASLCVALAVITGFASYGESQLLVALHKVDSLSTLRLSNQLFSIFMVLVIFKFNRATWPRFIDVRRHTFGLYLAHSMVLQFFTYHLQRVSLQHPRSIVRADAEATLLWIVLSAVTYFCCLLLTAWLASSPSLQWTVGLTSEDAGPRRPANLGFAPTPVQA